MKNVAAGGDFDINGEYRTWIVIEWEENGQTMSVRQDVTIESANQIKKQLKKYLKLCNK